MRCSIEKHQQLVDAAKIEYRRLAELQKQGYEEDLDNDILDIQEAMDNMRAVMQRKPEKIKVTQPTQKLEMLNAMIKANGNDGSLALAFNNSKDYKPAKPSNLVEVNGNYILTTDLGTYSFKPGEIVSEPINGKTVTVPVMELTKYGANPEFRYGPSMVLNKNTKVYNMMVKELGSKSAVTSTNIGNYSKAMKNVILKLVNPTVKIDPILTIKAITAIINRSTVTSGQYDIRNHTVKFLQTRGMSEQIEESLFDAEYTQYEFMKESLIKSELFQKRVEFVGDELKKYTNDHTVLHELIHAGSVVFMKNNPEHPATKRVEAIFELAKEKKYGIGVNFGYWSTSKEEFLAEALSNPEMIYELMSIRPKNKMSKLSNLFESLIDTLLGMFGFEKAKRESLFEYLLDGYFAMVEERFASTPNPDQEKLHQDILAMAEELKEKMGSDAEVGIGSKFSDIFMEQAELSLADVLTENYLQFAAAEPEKYDSNRLALVEKIARIKKRAKLIQNEIDKYENEGKEIPINIIEHKTQNDAELAEIAKIEEAKKSPDEKVRESVKAINDFDLLTVNILAVYEKTMQDLGKGKVGFRLFESTADQTAGQIDLRSKEMHIRWNKMSRLSRVSEVFLHEVNHLMSSHVFKNNRKLRALMENLRDSAVDSGVTYKLFLEGIKNPTANEIAIAKMKFEYTFDKTANPEEFYAYATTNEQVYNAIKNVKITTPLIKQLEMDPNKKEPLKKVLNKLIEIVNSQWRMLTGRGVLGGKMITDMVLTIAKLDADATIARRNKTEAPAGITDYAKGKINQLDSILEPVIKQADMWSEKFSAKQSAKWLANHIKRVPLLNDLVETGISQYLWRMVTQDTTTTDVADMYMVFRHAKQKVEKHTADIRNGVKKVVTDLYADVDEGTKKAVAKIVLEGDLAQFTVAELKEYLENSEKRDADIAQMEFELNTDEATMKQINGLVEYLLTGVTTVHNQQINANNIVSELFKSKKKYTNANKEVVKLVDKLVSLKVLQKSDKTQVELLSKLDEDTLDKTIQMYRGYIDNMRDDATLGAYDPIPKGYTRPEDGLTKYELIPEEEIEAQQSIRMKWVETDEYVTVEGKRYYLMTGMVKSVGFNEGAIGLISHTTEGIPVSSLIRKNNELAGKVGLMDGELRRKTKKIIEAINNQDPDVIAQFKLGVGQSLVPVYDHQYRIVDYRIQLTKLEKEIHLPDRKTELSDLMSHTFSRSIKTSLTATQNKRVVDTIIQHSAVGVLQKPDEYVLVEEYTEEDKMNGVKREKRHDRWEYLPDHTKDYIYQKLGNKSIPIHKDFVELMTGEKDVTIGNFAKFGVDLKKYPVAKARLMALESYLAEILGYVKNAMVVLNSDVLLGNQTSNAVVAMTHGIDPITYTKKFKERWNQLNEYNEKTQQLAELEVKQMAGENVANRMKQLKRQLEGNVWDELVKDGQYTALVEDINIENQSEGQIYTMVNDYIEKKNWSGAVKTLRNMLYIDRTSALYGSMLKTVHYGDAITRQIIKEELEKKEIKKNGSMTPKAEREILNYLDQLLVNYGYTMNRWVSYMERIGGLFFMKYYLSQAKAIMSMTRRNPVMTALTQGTQRLTGLDFQDPIDTYLRSGIDGVAYRWMADDAPGQLLQPNIWDLIPDISSIVRMN